MNNINYLELINSGNIDKLIVVGVLILSSLTARQSFYIWGQYLDLIA